MGSKGTCRKTRSQKASVAPLTAAAYAPCSGSSGSSSASPKQRTTAGGGSCSASRKSAAALRTSSSRHARGAPLDAFGSSTASARTTRSHPGAAHASTSMGVGPGRSRWCAAYARAHSSASTVMRQTLAARSAPPQRAQWPAASSSATRPVQSALSRTSTVSAKARGGAACASVGPWPSAASSSARSAFRSSASLAGWSTAVRHARARKPSHTSAICASPAFHTTGGGARRLRGSKPRGAATSTCVYRSSKAARETQLRSSCGGTASAELDHSGRSSSGSSPSHSSSSDSMASGGRWYMCHRSVGWREWGEGRCAASVGHKFETWRSA